MLLEGSPGGAVVKNPPANAGVRGSIPGWGRIPGGGTGNPLQLFFTGESHGQRSLAGYSPWGRTEPDTTEQPSMALKLFDSGFWSETPESITCLGLWIFYAA